MLAFAYTISRITFPSSALRPWTFAGVSGSFAPPSLRANQVVPGVDGFLVGSLPYDGRDRIPLRVLVEVRMDRLTLCKTPRFDRMPAANSSQANGNYAYRNNRHPNDRIRRGCR